MKNLSRFTLALVATGIALSAHADTIEIVELDGGNHPTMLGGYEMTPFAEPTGTNSCTAAPSGDLLCFEDYFGDSVELSAGPRWWWEFPEHGNIFVVHGNNWIDLILPDDTMAFSLFVGASGSGHAWVQAHDSAGNATPIEHFDVGAGNTPGYGVYATGCNSIDRITIEPWEWGFGYLAISQGECHSVPEPAPIFLLGFGLLGMALRHRLRQKFPHIT